MRIVHLKPEQYREMPWRNGGGSTTGSRFPRRLGARRRSAVPVTGEHGKGGAGRTLSTFAGYDRTLVLLQGGGVQLSFGADAPPVTLSAPCSSADSPATGRPAVVFRWRGA